MWWSRGLGRAKDGARILRYFRGCHRLLPQNWLFSGVGPEPLSQWFSKCDPQSSSSLTWELVEMKILRPHPDRVKSEAGGLEEPRVLWWALWGPWCTLGLSTTLSQSVSPLFSPSVLLRGGPQDSWDKKWEAGQGGEEGASAAQPPPSPRWNGAAGAQGEGGCLRSGITLGWGTIRSHCLELWRKWGVAGCVFFCLGCFFRGIKGVCTLCKCILRENPESVSGASSAECLGSLCGDQSCPLFKVNSLLAGLLWMRGRERLWKECRARFRFSASECWRPS